MNTLSDFEISDLATQLTCGEFEIWLEASSKLETLDAPMQTSVYMAARPLAEERLYKARESAVPGQIVRELERTAEVAQKLGDYATACVMLDECIDLEKTHLSGWPWTFSSVASLFQELGDLSKAREYQEEAVRVARNESKIDGLTADMLFHLGTIAVAQGELEYSRRCFAESLVLRQSWKQRFPESNDRVLFLTYHEFAKILLAHKQAIPAIQLLAAAQCLGERIEDAEGFHEHPLFLELTAQARDITEDSVFQRAWEEGLLMAPEQIHTQIFAESNAV